MNELNYKQIVRSKKLLERELSSKSLLKEQKNWLHYAANSGSLETVEYLIKRGVDLEKKDQSKALPIDYAINNKRKEIYLLLKKYTKDKTWATKRKIQFILDAQWEHIWDWQSYGEVFDSFHFRMCSEKEKKEYFKVLPYFYQFISEKEKAPTLYTWLEYAHKTDLLELNNIIRVANEQDLRQEENPYSRNEWEKENYKLLKKFLKEKNWNIINENWKYSPSLLWLYCYQKCQTIKPDILSELEKIGFDLDYVHPDSKNKLTLASHTMPMITKMINELSGKTNSPFKENMEILNYSIQKLILKDYIENKSVNKIKML